jgi:hypothetical protein
MEWTWPTATAPSNLERFKAWCAQRHLMENFNFLNDRAANADNMAYFYQKYIRDHAPQQVNIAAPVKNAIEDKARTQDWNGMVADMQRAWAEIETLLMNNANQQIGGFQ